MTERDDRFAAALRGWGPIGIAATIAIALTGPVLEPLGAVLTLAWRWRSHTPWRDLGLYRPPSWPLTVAAGIGIGVALKLVMKALVMPLLGAPPVNPVYHYLAHNSAALPGMMFDVIVGAGFNEELVFRGFLFHRLGQLLGHGRWATATILFLTSVWFGIVHYPGQGWPGAEQAFFTGLVLGGLYLATRRLWVSMIAHAAFDIVAVLIIFWDLETRVAHWIFR